MISSFVLDPIVGEGGLTTLNISCFQFTADSLRGPFDILFVEATLIFPIRSAISNGTGI